MSRSVPRATVTRLPAYLRVLRALDDEVSTISSETIGAVAGVTSDQVRKDLSQLGSMDKRGSGYAVTTLRDALTEALGLNGILTVAVVGAGNLGMAIGGFPGYRAAGFEVRALYDVNPNRTGGSLGGLPIRHIDDYAVDSEESPYDIGVITTPPEAAAEVADLMVKAGTRAILNFAPVTLGCQGEVPVRNVRVVEELQILAHYLDPAAG